MKVTKTEKENAPEKMSYEQLENVAHQLSEQNRKMYAQMQQMDLTNAFKRLDYLFKVVEFEVSFPSSFVMSCTKEIEEMLTPHEEENSEETNTEE